MNRKDLIEENSETQPDDINVSENTAVKKTNKKLRKISEFKNSRFCKGIKKHKILTGVICIILVACIVLGSFFAYKHFGDTATPYSFVRTTTLAKGNLDESISTTGTIKSASTSTVTSSLNYKVTAVHVAVGDTVNQGDVICTLDDSELLKQIEREQESVNKSLSSAQNSHDSALNNYNQAVSALENYKSTYNSAESTVNTAYVPYSAAKNAISSYQTAYDNALSAYNTSGTKYVTSHSSYTNVLNKFKAGSADSSELISSAKAYMTATQNHYGGCAVGSYNISDGASQSNSQSGSPTGGSSASSNNSTGSGGSSVTVTQTADTICNNVINNVYSLTGTRLTYSSTTGTLNKLSVSAKNLQDAKTQTNYNNLESNYNSTKSSFESVKQTYKQYEQAVSQAKEQLEQAKNQLSSASSSSNLDELNTQLNECTLKAQQNGTVVSLNATVGSAPSGMEAIATISDLNSLKVSVTIEEADINKVTIGMKCYITGDATSTVLNGTLTQIDPVAGENGSFGAEVTIIDTTSEFRIGMNASVEILVSSTSNVFQVPLDAIGSDQNGSFVYRKTGGEGVDMTFEKVYITTGNQNDFYIEISGEDLKEEDVIRSSSDLTQGIETDETSEKENSSSTIPFGGMLNGGNMPSGSSPPDMGNMPSGNGQQRGNSSGGQPGSRQ